MKIIFCFFMLILMINPCFAFGFKSKKKKKAPIEKMVETRQDWEIKAQNVPLSDRKLEIIEPPKSDKKNYYPDTHYTFELYNFPAGKRGYDIRFIKKNLVEHPIMVADKECHYIAYANYYYRSDINQIYSDFYIEKLDSSKTKTQRILEYNHKQLKRAPVLLSGFKEQYKNLFNGLSLVDWSQDSNKVLIKECIGSTINGIYRTYIYLHFVDKDKTLKLDNFTEAIVNYYLDSQDIAFVKYRYNIEPLGFSSDNDDIILANFWGYTKENKRIFLGVWGYDINDNKTILISKTDPSVSVSANGLVLKRVLE